MSPELPELPLESEDELPDDLLPPEDFDSDFPSDFPSDFFEPDVFFSEDFLLEDFFPPLFFPLDFLLVEERCTFTEPSFLTTTACPAPTLIFSPSPVEGATSTSPSSTEISDDPSSSTSTSNWVPRTPATALGVLMMNSDSLLNLVTSQLIFPR